MPFSLHFNRARSWWIQLLVLFLYYLLVVLPHQKIGGIIATTFDSKLRSRYDLIFQFAALACLGLAIFFLARNLIQYNKYPFTVSFSIVTIVLTFLASHFLFTLNVEFVHFVQYAIFAFLCFPLTKSLFQSYVWAGLAGMIDELYQYVYLAPGSDYYDFNDIILNMIGAGYGLLFARIIFKKFNKISWRNYLKSFQAKFIIGLIMIIGIMYMVGFISYGPDPNAFLVLFKKPYQGFWSIIDPNVKLHVIKPEEGLCFMIALFAIYFSFDKVTNGAVESD